MSRWKPGWAFWAVWSLAGCSSLPHPPVPLDARSGLFDSAQLVYQFDAGRLGVPVAVSRIESQRVSYDEVPSQPRAGRSTGQLEICYPHPQGYPGLAEARVTIESRTPAGGELELPWFLSAGQAESARGPVEVREIWVLDLPRDELTRLVGQLQTGGFFSENPPADAGARLYVRLNGRDTSKNWTPLPELDALMRQVRGQGQLLSYSRSTAAPRPSGSPVSSVRQYRALLAAEQRPAEPVQPAAAWTGAGLSERAVLVSGLPVADGVARR
jgi:hypothetical protein